jgi:hypothetical protein
MLSPVKYKVVHEDRVEYYLAEGWELYGSPIWNDRGRFYQAMTLMPYDDGDFEG